MSFITRLLSLKDSEIKLVVFLIEFFEVRFRVNLLDRRSLVSGLLILVSFLRIAMLTVLAAGAPFFPRFSMILARLALLFLRSAPSRIFV
jgi:hypothetical protein